MFSFIRRIISLFTGGRELERALPQVFEIVDGQLPGMLGYAGGGEVEELIARSIAKATGKKPNKKQIRKVIKRYDPTIGATKALRARK